MSPIENLGKTSLESNPNLISISGLANLDTIKGNITLVGNSNLSICEINALCNRINPITSITINSNGSNCNTIAEVQQSCDLLLPVTIHSFNIENNSSLNQLHWQTSSEINNHYFDIEYSIDGIDFATIGRKEGAGNSNTKLDYHFVHQNVESGMHYYRIKQVDYDGQYSYSDIKSVHVKGESEGISIYPNPATHIINVNGADGLYYVLYDLVGRQVHTGIISGSAFSIDQLATGMYYLDIKDTQLTNIFKMWKE